MQPVLRRASVLAVGLLVVACAAPAPSPSPSAAPSAVAAGTRCETAPAPASMDGWGTPATPPTALPYLVSNGIVCGKARLLLLFLDSENRVVSAPDRTASIDFYDLGRDPGKAVAAAEGEFLWTIPDERGMYVVNVDLPEAGTWGAEITTEAPGQTTEKSRLTFEVLDASPTIQVGDKAPSSDSPTLDDVGGDVSKLSTDTKPDTDFYTTSVADALAAKDPFVLVFATPKFCTSAQCGPTLDDLKPVAAANPDVTFINVEPYQLQDVDGQLQPVLTGDPPGLTSAATTDEWGLMTEPWIFAVDREGIVRGSYEIMASPAELDAVLKEIGAN